MRPDADIDKDVETELDWDPNLDATDIGVVIKDGVVTLSGFVHSLNEKWEAERAARSVAGVLAVANDLEVRLPQLGDRTDPEIARDVVNAIRHEVPEIADSIKVVVNNGAVTLEGKVPWHGQLVRAAAAAGRVRGVAVVTNLAEIAPHTAPENIKRKIAEALKRNAVIDAARIAVEAQGSEVVLTGTVRSWAERKEAEEAAWRAPGITKVDNRITIDI